MDDKEILNQIDNIYNAVDRLRKEPLSETESNILSIGNMIDALRDNVEDELLERKYEIDYLKEEIESLRDKIDLARMENYLCLSNCP